LGSFYNVHNTEATSLEVYYKNAFQNVSFLDLNSSLIKALVYGFTIGIVGCYKGYYATHGPRGVGKATNQAVILSIFLIFFEEVIIVQIINWIRYY
jgi:phospholipid/cholesterol/gamma-HCH transport system permease protein